MRTGHCMGAWEQRGPWCWSLISNCPFRPYVTNTTIREILPSEDYMEGEGQFSEASYTPCRLSCQLYGKKHTMPTHSGDSYEWPPTIMPATAWEKTTWVQGVRLSGRPWHLLTALLVCHGSDVIWQGPDVISQISLLTNLALSGSSMTAGSACGYDGNMNRKLVLH